MTRALLLGLALLATACGSKKPGESVCENTVPPPAACNTACDPAPGAPNACPSGYHCTPDGKCDASCTVGGGQCGAGFECTTDGLCVSDGTGSGDPPIDAKDCPAVRVTGKKVVPVVELLLDQSGSMVEPYPNMGDPRRWDVLVDVLVDPTNGVVKQLAPSVILGSTLYTAENSGDCIDLQTVPRRIDNFAAIRDQLENNQPGNNTPTGESIAAVVADFAANPPADPAAPKIIVLATDGLPDNCDNHNPDGGPGGAEQLAVNAFTEVEAQKAFTAGIKIFYLFIGNADTNVVTHAKRMANAGAGKDLANGDERFFEATNAADLTMHFNTILGSVIPCEVTLSDTVSQDDAPLGMVTINGAPLRHNDDWTLDADGLTIRLKTDACNRLQAATDPTIEAVFPCGTIIF
jgi:hypothetical protein